MPLEPVEFETVITSPLEPSTLRFFCANEKERLNRLFNGRPIQLSESSQQTLQVIGSFGRKGLTQAELARVLDCDSRNAFHWLKGLLSNDLVVKTPVASKKSFTHLLTLARFLDEDETVPAVAIPSADSEHQLIPSSKEIRQTIVNILAKAPNQTMSSRDVFAATGLDRSLVKNYRRAVTKLCEIGWLEFVISESFVGPCLRVFRLTRNPADGLDLNKFLLLQDSSKKQQSDILVEKARGEDFKFNEPIIHQIILLLALAYPEPLTTLNLTHQLGISRKYLYRLIDRIIPPGSKCGTEGVGKVSEFVGKERRLKLFIKTEVWRNSYISMFAPSQASTEHLPQVSSYASSQLSSSAPQSPSASSTNLTRQRRHQAILKELSSSRILDIGKELCARIQKSLGDSRFVMDVKTLRRSADILEKEGLLKIVVVSISSGSRTLLLSPELDPQDPLVTAHISSLQHQSRVAQIPESTAKSQIFKQQITSDPNYFVDGSLPLDLSSQNPSALATARHNFGFISGILARVELFHRFLASTCKKIDAVENCLCFDTQKVVFEELPLGLYFKIIGSVRMSHSMHNQFSELEHTAISHLSDPFKEELLLNKKRFQSQAIILLHTLQDLKVIQGIEQGTDDVSAMLLKLPLKYKFALEVPLYNYKGNIVKLVRQSQIDEFWNGMRAISVEYIAAQHRLSLHSEAEAAADFDNENSIPNPVLLARFSESWKIRPSLTRELEQTIRKLAVECFSHQRKHQMKNIFDWPELLDRIRPIISKFEVSRECVETKLAHSLKLLKNRQRLKRRAKHEQDNDDSDSSDESDDDSTTSQSDTRWTPADKLKLSLAFCILQQDLFLKGSSASGIKWNLATKIFEKARPSLSVRRHGLKMFKSYSTLERILEMDTVVQLVMKQMDFTQLEANEAGFKAVFDQCEFALSSSAGSDDSLFIPFKSPDASIPLPMNRTGHYLSSIDSWVQTRIFRHDLFQNANGLELETTENITTEVEAFSKNETLMKMRQILISSALESFDQNAYNSTTEILKSMDQNLLNEAIEKLILCGFAVRNRSRDRHRLFAFPLTISEAVRDMCDPIVEAAKPLPSLSENLTVDGSLESLTFSGVQELVHGILDHKINISMQENPNLHTPIILSVNSNIPAKSGKFNLNLLTENHASHWIWSDLLGDSRIIDAVAQNCLRHVELSIAGSPGITISSLKQKYSGLLLQQEIDLLLNVLCDNNSIQVIQSKFLLPK